MPTMLHEALVGLLRGSPQLAADIARGAAKLPRSLRAELEAASFPQHVAPERHADAVMRLVDRRDQPRLGLVVEVQQSIDPEKRLTWPLYAAQYHAALGCTVYLVVVTTRRAVARWARAPIATFQPNGSFAPLVVGPDEIPRVTDVDEARKAPALGVLSALTHAREEKSFDLALAGIAASDALRAVDEDSARLYHELIRQSLPTRLLRALDKHMQIKGFEFTSEFARKHRAEGKAEGRVEGKAEAVIAVLEGRGLAVHDAARVMILACREREQLDRWLARAGTVASVDDLLDEAHAG